MGGVCVVGCLSCVRVSSCCRRLLWLRFSVRLQGGLLVGVHLGIADVWGFGCELLVLLDECGFSMRYIVCCVCGDVVSPLVSFAGVESEAIRGRLRALGCDVGVWWLGRFVVVL